MAVFFTVFLAFIIFSVVMSEKDRKRREAAKRRQIPLPGDIFKKEDIQVPEPTTAPRDNTYHGEEVPRTTQNASTDETRTKGKELDLDPEKMIIYSEILKPKF